ncbi:ATP-dependent DNA helicase PIF1-like, partial [Aphis craccivora]
MAGIGLREECFSHGQFYVTCFRVSESWQKGAWVLYSFLPVSFRIPFER